jgi:DNA-binding NarL/FixJ family response regulator
MKVLVVEDDALVALDLADVIRALGHEVVGPFPSAETAMSASRSDRVDYGLLDFNLGATTSAAVADTLLDRGTPFAFVTGYRPDVLPERFRRVTVLAKPVLTGQLAALLHDV